MGSIKVMLLGIALMLLPLYIQNEPGIRFFGNEFFILVFGFIPTLIGLFIKDRKHNK
ncbi:hypothetical protein SAMN05216232_2613 [Virgibacillus subterraneus]|uniref:Uncharacterized protein n=2 Tax=Virgibacillus TaxID=84406 RepID=A0A1H1EXT0_9BACI|nr:hypothetical protein [Virgibacillus subterraneus]SDQ93512.1 hypothetical protein SAMN05216231_3104 [Virgibacillus salinus]SEQ49504.1 hypothetical protein SAMN05216232_2613 [Virgibacillus subterraneus]